MNEDELDSMEPPPSEPAPKSPARTAAPAQAVASPAQLNADEGSPTAEPAAAAEPAADAEPDAAAPAPVVQPPNAEPAAPADSNALAPAEAVVDIPSPGAERFINTMSNVGGNLSELGATDVSDGMLELSRRWRPLAPRHPHASHAARPHSPTPLQPGAHTPHPSSQVDA